jgi:hypothetical protein
MFSKDDMRPIKVHCDEMMREILHSLVRKEIRRIESDTIFERNKNAEVLVVLYECHTELEQAGT